MTAEDSHTQMRHRGGIDPAAKGPALSINNAPQTLTTFTTTRIAYDPVKQGVEKAVYSAREEPSGQRHDRLKDKRNLEKITKERYGQESKIKLRNNFYLVISIATAIVAASILAVIFILGS